MVTKLADAKVYTDMDGLGKLRYQAKTNPEVAKKEVAQQFEALLMQILLRSMREANKSFASDLFGGDQMALYQDMLDKQMSLIMSESGTGFAKIIEKNMEQQYSKEAQAAKYKNSHVVARMPAGEDTASIKNIEKPQPIPPQPVQPTFNSQEEFVQGLWGHAKQAANLIGVDPKILLAQAALETNWGKKIITNNQTNDSSHNLFNIKADNSWTKKTAVTDTLEQKNGVLVKEKAAFRSYGSYMDSFMDYAHFLKNNSRYEDALNKATDPKQFVQALQSAGYATDSNYAEKILTIFSSRTFKNLVDKLE